MSQESSRSPTAAVSPAEFEERLGEVARTYLRSVPVDQQDAHQRAVAILAEHIFEATGRRDEVQFPWAPTPELADRIRDRVTDGETGAQTWRAVLRLWAAWTRAGLVRSRLGSRPVRRYQIANPTGGSWPMVTLVGRVEEYLSSEAAFLASDATRHSRESQLVANAVLVVAVEGTAPYDLLPVFQRMDRSHLDLRGGRLLVPSKHGAPQRYALGPRARLHLAILVGFYRLRSRTSRPQAIDDGNTLLLSQRWRKPGALTNAIRRHLNVIARGSPGCPTGRWHDFLLACRIYAGLDKPVSLIAFRSRQFLVAPAIADLTNLGLPLSAPPSRPSRQSPEEKNPPAVLVGKAVTDAVLEGALERAISGLRSRLVDEERAARTADLQNTLQTATPAISNARIFAEYAVEVLRSRLKVTTVHNRLSGLYPLINAALDGIPISALTREELQDRCVDFVQQGLEVSTRRAMRSRLRLFITFAQASGYITQGPDWSDPDLLVPDAVTWQPILLPGEVDRLLMAATERGALGLAAAIALWFGLGLRRSEVTGLGNDDVLLGPLEEIAIRTSKSAAGIRILPAKLLLSPSIRRVIEDYLEWRRRLSGKLSSWLLDPVGRPYSPDALGRAFTRLAKAILGRVVGAHALRRSFAAWAYLRHAQIYLGIPAISDGSPLGNELVTPEVLGSLRQAFELTELHDPESTGLRQIAAFLGHASPAVSAGYYAMAIEWLQFVLAAREELPGWIGIREAAQVIGISDRRLRDLLRARDRRHGEVRLAAVLRVLLSRVHQDNWFSGGQR